MPPRPTADFLRGLVAAYALYLAWINAQGLWLGLGLWFKYHRYVPLQLWLPLAIFAAYAVVAGTLAFPGNGPRRLPLLVAALLLTALLILPAVLLAIYWAQQPASGFLPGFVANEIVRAALAGAAWFLFRRASRA